MPDSMFFSLPDAPCPACGGVMSPTTVLCRDPDLGDGIMVERAGLCCRACGAEALDATAVTAPPIAAGRRAA